LGLSRIAIVLGSLSTAITAIAVTGHVGVILIGALAGFLIVLIAVIAMTGTFGSKGCRHDAQAVLAILLGQGSARPPGSSRQAGHRGLR
jgi:hypothetical protein